MYLVVGMLRASVLLTMILALPVPTEIATAVTALAGSRALLIAVPCTVISGHLHLTPTNTCTQNIEITTHFTLPAQYVQCNLTDN